jgi:hypothetical protein
VKSIPHTLINDMKRNIHLFIFDVVSRMKLLSIVGNDD